MIKNIILICLVSISLSYGDYWDKVGWAETRNISLSYSAILLVTVLTTISSKYGSKPRIFREKGEIWPYRKDRVDITLN
jgi:hypothetical protein